MLFRNWAPILSIALLCTVPTAARADTLMVSESGVWGASAPTTLWSAPGESWSYSFLTSSTALASDVVKTDHGIRFQRDFSDFTYTLDGASVSTVPDHVSWYSAAWAGLVNVNFGAGTFADMSFEPEGQQTFDSNLTIIPGTYSIDNPYSAVAFSNPSQLLPLTGELVIAKKDTTVTPEPSSLLLLGTGLVGAYGVARRRMRRA